MPRCAPQQIENSVWRRRFLRLRKWSALEHRRNLPRTPCPQWKVCIALHPETNEMDFFLFLNEIWIDFVLITPVRRRAEFWKQGKLQNRKKLCWWSVSESEPSVQDLPWCSNWLDRRNPWQKHRWLLGSRLVIPTSIAEVEFCNLKSRMVKLKCILCLHESDVFQAQAINIPEKLTRTAGLKVLNSLARDSADN